jgi:hypothetical protein
MGQLGSTAPSRLVGYGKKEVGCTRYSPGRILYLAVRRSTSSRAPSFSSPQGAPQARRPGTASSKGCTSWREVRIGEGLIWNVEIKMGSSDEQKETSLKVDPMNNNHIRLDQFIHSKWRQRLFMIDIVRQWNTVRR